jgi:hypothetical protein
LGLSYKSKAKDQDPDPDTDQKPDPVVKLCDDPLVISKSDILNATLLILQHVNFNLNISTSYDFLLYYEELLDDEKRNKSLGLLIEATKTTLPFKVKASRLAKMCIEYSTLEEIIEHCTTD